MFTCLQVFIALFSEFVMISTPEKAYRGRQNGETTAMICYSQCGLSQTVPILFSHHTCFMANGRYQMQMPLSI
jgi:hypothetical protein